MKNSKQNDMIKTFKNKKSRDYKKSLYNSDFVVHCICSPDYRNIFL